MDEPAMRGSRSAVPDGSVAIVVLNWNGWRDTIVCLESLMRLEAGDHRVIVVDNGSDDDSVDRIRRVFPGVTLLETGRNLGFAGGCNVGIRHALEQGASFVWLLNNDTIVAPDSLGAMVNVMRRRGDMGVVGSVIRSLDRAESVEAWGGGRVNRFLGTTLRNLSPDARLDYVAGTSMMIRRAVFEDTGLLDEDFFFYLEDVDFCRRATATGWKLAVAREAGVWHRGGATVNAGRTTRSERADRFHTRSSGVFVGKHAGRWVVPSAVARLSGIAARRLARRQVRRLPELCREFLRGTALGRRART